MSKQKGHPHAWCAPERVEWLPGVHDLRTAHAVISAKFTLPVNKKSARPPISEPLVTKSQKHVIHRAMEWEEMLNTGEATSLA